jgi:DNA topoisomerase-3
MAEKFEKVERVEDWFEGELISFKRVWAGHRFSDREVEKLLKGEEITFTANKKDGGTFKAKGKLGKGNYEGHEFWGFQLNPFEKREEN